MGLPYYTDLYYISALPGCHLQSFSGPTLRGHANATQMPCVAQLSRELIRGPPVVAPADRGIRRRTRRNMIYINPCHVQLFMMTFHSASSISTLAPPTLDNSGQLDHLDEVHNHTWTAVNKQIVFPRSSISIAGLEIWTDLGQSVD